MASPAAKRGKFGPDNRNSLVSWLSKPPSTPPRVKDTSTESPSKTRKSGIDPEWKESFPWLIITEDKQGMLCKYCSKFNMKPKNGSDTWISTPCTLLIRASLVRHSSSTIHKDASDREAQFILAGKGQGIQAAINKHCSLEKAALIGAFRCMYWLAIEEIPHTTHYESLIELAKTLGCDYLNLLRKADNVNYTSQRTMQDILECISGQIREPILQNIRDSPYYSILIDETTDIAVVKQMSVLARYFASDMSVKTSFLGLVDLPDGKAVTIYDAIKKFLEDNGLPSKTLIGLGSDGASVMVGRKAGVSALLKKDNPELINIHCIAHRLALASAQATDNIPYLKKFKCVMQQIYKFYQNSAVRMAGLKELESVLGEPSLKMKEILDTRWLSHESAVTAVRRCLPSLICSLEREASERADATAAGLALFVKDIKFVSTIAMLSDVLPHLNRLSKTFQKTSVDFTMVDPLVSATQITLLRLLEHPGQHMTALPEVVDSLKEFGVQQSNDDFTSFKDGIYSQYINNVIENLYDRFPDNNILDALTAFDPDLLDSEEPSQNEWLQFQKLQTLSEHFTSVGSVESVKEEYMSLRVLIARDMKNCSFRDAMDKVISLNELYPRCGKFCEIALVLPVSTADCERTFSCLNRVKTVLRNRLSQRVLNYLMTISTEGPSLDSFDFSLCVSVYGKIKNRKISTE